MRTAARLDAGVSLPGEPGYEKATRVFNLSAPARPAAAVTATTPEQVQAAVRYARAARLPVRVHTTGHASAAGRPMDGALLVRPRLRGRVRADAGRRIARIPAGTTWGEVVREVARQGLAVAHGSSALVGAVGYLLGGGVSFYGRTAGLASNAVRAVELVTADGEARRVDAASDPELFWAVRGGGGGLGVVTAVEVGLFPASQVVTGAAFWPAAQAGRLLPAWLAWSRHAPEEATTSLRIIDLPPGPDLPSHLRSGPVVCVDGAVLAATPDDVRTARRQAEDLLGPLRAIAVPIVDTWRPAAPAAVLGAHLDAPDPVPFIGDHMLLDGLGGDAADAFLRVAGEGSGSPLVLAGFRHLGGAFDRPDPAGGALTRVRGPYAYMASGAPIGPVTGTALREHCAKIRDALAPWDTGWTVPSLVESAAQPQRHLTEQEVRGVDRVRTRVDPDGLFRGDVAPNATALAADRR
ncbi:FAD-binding oxidoreductase [Actinomadura fibrosa]|uniref:FAD-binding oxidoreductase n=1 Tax=Actinomadura fibrosa TaxID=111802 RepID=A0ABW2Y0Z4_9ACTN|nr:FAD-binding protein [Actinomadura fibrosa]